MRQGLTHPPGAGAPTRAHLLSPLDLLSLLKAALKECSPVDCNLSPHPVIRPVIKI